jgi:NhaA family Na+:H+ antiporter
MVNRFFSLEAIGGILLLVFTIFSLVIANVPALECILDFFNTELSINLGNYFNLSMSLAYWINDGLMVLFFFTVGLEIKREILVGELSSFKQASLPITTAIGGMVVPAIIYAFCNASVPGQEDNGWGIPMATDIAFAIGIISLLGKRMPISLIIFLTALAIVDDLGAIIVIAIFYPAHALHFEMLLIALAVMALIYLFNILRIRATVVYIIAGIALWLAILESGLHATIAGVLLAIVIPISAKHNPIKFLQRSKRVLSEIKVAQSKNKNKIIANEHQKELVHNIQYEINQAISPLQQYEYSLHPWVMYIIMPLFALVNAGVKIDSVALSGLFSSISIGVFLGLFLGKPLGIMLLSWLSVKCKIAQLPREATWGQLIGVGFMAGIGFTMSIFIANLAFTDEGLVSTAKLAILITSLIAGIIGILILRATSSKDYTEYNISEEEVNSQSN